VTGLEPATSGVTGRRSNQLSYTRSGRRQRLGWAVESVKGICRDLRKPAIIKCPGECLCVGTRGQRRNGCRRQVSIF
jgi:hypothetical protein